VRSPSVSGTADDRERILGLLHGFRTTSIVLAALSTGVLDALQDAGKDESSLARETGAHAPSLSRFLRALERIGIVQRSGGMVSLTAMGRRLADPAEVFRARAKLIGEEYVAAWQHLAHTVLTGETAFERAFGMSAWEYRAQRPELSAAFDHTMADHRTRAARAVLSAYDFSQARTIVDVGGGRGGLIAELLAALPHARGVVFDQPHVVASAAKVLRAAGVADRSSIVGGSFFDAVPAGGDAYVLQYVLHDWSDERCIALLRRCRAAMDARARLLIVENLVPARADPSDHVVMLDLHMMVMLGGRERNRDEFAALLRTAGFELVATVPTHGAGYVLVAALARDEGAAGGMSPRAGPPNDPHWGVVAYQWQAYGPPLRPSPPDIAAMERSVRAWRGGSEARGPRVLLLGVTPEIAEMAWPAGTKLTAIDRSEAMIAQVWPGDVAGVRTAIRADWFDHDYGRIDIVIGDGVFPITRYPDQYQALIGKIAAALPAGGLFVTRPFLQVAKREVSETVVRDLVEGRIGSIHAFKFRLAMSLQVRAQDGVRHGDVFDAARRAGIDCDTLAARTGWSELEIDTLRIYESKDARLYFPSAEEMASLMADHFDTVAEERFDYEMGERCPVMTYRRR